MAPDCIGDITGRMIADLTPGDAMLLENLRFHPEEEANDRDFSHELARGKQVYVNDAFGTAHRAHASTVGVTQFIPERAAGFLMIRELEALRAVTENPAHPYVAILGGAKVSDKIGVIRNLITKVDAILIGGAMAYTFLKANGIPIGKSRVEDDKLELARELMAEAAKRNVAFVLPVDHRRGARAFRGRARRDHGRDSGGSDGVSISVRARWRILSRDLSAAKTDRLEWSAGIFRDSSLCRRHA